MTRAGVVKGNGIGRLFIASPDTRGCVELVGFLDFYIRQFFKPRDILIQIKMSRVFFAGDQWEKKNDQEEGMPLSDQIEVPLQGITVS